MTPIRVEYLVWPQAGKAPWGEGAIVIGSADLDPSDAMQRPDGLWTIKSVPDHLRAIADQLESGMTTGPDPEVWLDDSPSWCCDRCGSPRWVGWRNGPAHHGLPVGESR